METKINLLGIVRNTSNLNSPAGSCQELINLRKKYGTWRPIMPKLAIKTNFTSIDNTVFIHTMDDASYFIIYNPGDGTIKAYDSTTPFAYVETLLTIASKPTSLKIDALGYYLIASDLESYEKYIFRCTPSAAIKYVDVSNMPSINMVVTSENTAEYFEYNAKYDNDSFQAGWYLLEKDARESYPEYFEGYVFVRWAIELIDGTVLKHSRPVFLYSGSVTLTNISNPAPALYIKAYRSLLRYTLPNPLPSGWSKYSDLIRGVSIFMSKPISKYDLSVSGLNDVGSFIDLYEKPLSLADIFRNESLYYRIYHIPYNKISAGGTDVIGSGKSIAAPMQINIGFQSLKPYANYYGLKSHTNPYKVINPSDLNINDITAYDLLNVDDVSHNTLIGFTSLNYNNRLFFFDIYTKLYDGYNISDIILPTGGDVSSFTIYIEVDLDTEYGLRTVRQSMTSTKDSIIIPYLIGYPDKRAKQLRIIHNQGGLFKQTIYLETHPVLNMAVNSIITVLAKDTNGYQTITIASINTVATLATLSTSIRDRNRVQLTDLYNPFIAPPINSYQVGEGNIVAAGVNMLPLEDKFGTFPVFVFTSRGIWALNLSDTGGIVISNITPVSSAVCINADSVIVVDNLLVFLASDGIKLLTGAVPSEISDIAEGPFASVLAGNTEYGLLKAHASINVVTDQISSTDILTYAVGAKFAYDKNLREIIVSNYNYGYSYIYSLDEKTWYKSNGKYKKFITQYPNVYALSTGNDLVDISQEQTSGNVGCFIETKPIPIGPDKELKLSKTILGGIFDVANTFYGVLYMFASNDGRTWSLLQGKEITGQSIFNIQLPKNPISVRYVILVFSGTVTKESSISEIRVIT